MTNGELIAQLSEFPEHWKAEVLDSSGDSCPIEFAEEAYYQMVFVNIKRSFTQ